MIINGQYIVKPVPVDTSCLKNALLKPNDFTNTSIGNTYQSGYNFDTMGSFIPSSNLHNNSLNINPNADSSIALEMIMGVNIKVFDLIGLE